MTNTPFKNIFSNRLTKHILYWIGLIIFFGITWGTYDNDYVRSFTIQTFGLPARMILVYISIYVLLPGFLLKKRFISFIISYIVLLIITSVCIQRPIIYFYVEPIYFPDWKSEGYFTITELMNTILDVNIAAIIPLSFSFFKFYYNAQQRTLTLEKEKIETELIQLRNQVHPHFLFNTLNTLYGLIIKKSNTAETAVLKLSKLMRYMLYEANTPKVSLKKEIEYLKNYVDLEKLRFDNSIDISFNSESDKDYKISPFLLIPFVENAFKHGTSSSNKSWIVINIFTKKKELILRVENSKFSSTNTQHDSIGGIGFNNVKKRLQLLYPNKHSLKIEDNELSYEVILKLNLAKTNQDE
ncbi:Histidine kinase [Aquimarina amphilecti]|uniref:Histidine kinase n=1 Tax=Aquimarina amphilecti TaxID=1038014 RepID=A0A1H7VXD6_AQUAM|nr:sensor histidine kinase [Aquimarina amphilecti]SEM13714.1 Histidine kinase [Aquimarina amphilecti]